MVDVERALARVQAPLGIVPTTAAEAIDRTLEGYRPDLSLLHEGAAADAVPVPALVRALRVAVGGSAADFVHYGATSQDILDTAFVLQLSGVLDVLEDRRQRLVEALAVLADRHRRTAMVGRTRYQQAAPTAFGVKVTGWLLPLVRHGARLTELRPRVLCVQLGGATGHLSAFGALGPAMTDALATELGLAVPPAPWHAQRDGFVELGAWFLMVGGGLGKIGSDVLSMAQTEVGELAEGQGGGSSSLPQKANPIRAEALVTLARRAPGDFASLAQALVHVHERDGAAWQLEAPALAKLAVGAAASLRVAAELVDGLVVDPVRMVHHLDHGGGTVLAEGAILALLPHVGRAEAESLVKSALAAAVADGSHLIDEIASRATAPVDWAAALDPAQQFGAVDALIDSAIAAAGLTLPPSNDV